MTKEQIKRSKIFSPGLLKGKVVRFLPSADKTFFVKEEDEDGYSRDESGKYLKLSMDQVINARFDYLQISEEQEKNDAIEEELERLQKDLRTKAEKYISEITKLEKYSNADFGDHTLTFILDALEPNYKENKQKGAVAFFEAHPGAIELRDYLQKCIDRSDYESLYNTLEFRFGKPLVSFKNGSNVDFTAIRNVIGKNSIENTLKNFEDKGSLWLMAKANVEKRYHPESV